MCSTHSNHHRTDTILPINNTTYVQNDKSRKPSVTAYQTENARSTHKCIKQSRYMHVQFLSQFNLVPFPRYCLAVVENDSFHI